MSDKIKPSNEADKDIFFVDGNQIIDWSNAKKNVDVTSKNKESGYVKFYPHKNGSASLSIKNKEWFLINQELKN